MSDLELVNRKHWPHHQATGSKGVTLSWVGEEGWSFSRK